jgi:hypothetical protein
VRKERGCKKQNSADWCIHKKRRDQLIEREREGNTEVFAAPNAQLIFQLPSSLLIQLKHFKCDIITLGVKIFKDINKGMNVLFIILICLN